MALGPGFSSSRHGNSTDFSENVLHYFLDHAIEVNTLKGIFSFLLTRPLSRAITHTIFNLSVTLIRT